MYPFNGRHKTWYTEKNHVVMSKKNTYFVTSFRIKEGEGEGDGLAIAKTAIPAPDFEMPRISMHFLF